MRSYLSGTRLCSDRQDPQRDTGKYSLSTTCNDLISILNDLHKGRQAGPVWSWVIDISAIVSALVAFSGFVLVFYLKQNRVLRIATAVVGAVVLLWMILIATS
ncbi:MAG: PepSY-associated TM helix domain-containing protein [Pirellula sp.]